MALFYLQTKPKKPKHNVQIWPKAGWAQTQAQAMSTPNYSH